MVGLVVGSARLPVATVKGRQAAWVTAVRAIRNAGTKTWLRGASFPEPCDVYLEVTVSVEDCCDVLCWGAPASVPAGTDTQSTLQAIVDVVAMQREWQRTCRVGIGPRDQPP